MKQVPFLLICSRMIIGFIIGIITLIRPPGTPVLIVSLMTIGLITDIMDGILARRIGVATQRLRVWDSNVDQFFWIVVISSIFWLNINFIQSHYLPIVIIAVLESLAYLMSYLKFRRTIATHTYLAKYWTLTLFAFLTDLALHGQSGLWFKICVAGGIISRLEIIAIIAALKNWATDVPSILSVRSINRR